MTDKLNIITPKSGLPTSVVLITHNDRIVGSLVFEDPQGFKHFKKHYDILIDQEIGFGSISMGFDCDDKS